MGKNIQICKCSYSCIEKTKTWRAHGGGGGVHLFIIQSPVNPPSVFRFMISKHKEDLKTQMSLGIKARVWDDRHVYFRHRIYPVVWIPAFRCASIEESDQQLSMICRLTYEAPLVIFLPFILFYYILFSSFRSLSPALRGLRNYI